MYVWLFIVGLIRSPWSCNFELG